MTASPSSGKLSDNELAEIGDIDPAGPSVGGDGVFAGENFASWDSYSVEEEEEDLFLLDRFSLDFLSSDDEDLCTLRLDPEPE